MPFKLFKKFSPPDYLSTLEQLKFTVGIVEKHRQEARILRHDTAWAKLSQKKSKEAAEHWQERYQQSQEELKKARREIGILKEENGKLEKEIERLTKTNLRYQVSLFDHGNFKTKGEGTDKKPKGGQLNHPDTNREGQTNFPGYDTFPRKRIYAKSCDKCGNNLGRVSSFKEKVLLDIVIKPEITQMILESERQWCKTCKAEINAKHEQTLPFTEYGLNTFMMVMILRFKGHLSMGSISAVFRIAFGLKLSKSDISNLLISASNYLGSKYLELIQEARKGKIIYADETGWQVKGEKAWMWIMATEDTEKQKGITVYLAAESRGKGIAQDLYGSSLSYCMTDGLKSYLNTIPPHKHCYCWAHMLRFSFEETIHSNPASDAVSLRENLVRIYHFKKDCPEVSKDQLKTVLQTEVSNLLNLTSDETSFNNIQHRLKEQKEGLILSLLETDDGTNNLAERELRAMVLNRKVSNGSDTYAGMQTSATLGSIIQTLSRQNLDILTELALNLQISIHQKYPQYQHFAYQDTS